MDQKSNARPHLSVMLSECLKFFADIPLSIFYEGTLGAGGHTRAILEAHPEIKRYIACDRDPQAIDIAKKHLEPWKDKLNFVQGDFSDLDSQLKDLGIEAVDGFFLIWGCRLCNSI